MMKQEKLLMSLTKIGTELVDGIVCWEGAFDLNCCIKKGEQVCSPFLYLINSKAPKKIKELEG